MATNVDQASDTGIGFARLAILLAVPTIALSLMAALALQQDTPSGARASAPTAGLSQQDAPSSAPASGTTARLSRQDDENFTLYILDSARVALDEAKWLHYLEGGGPLQAWYALVNSPEEEAELEKALDHADWIRVDAGLPSTRIVDLRRP